MQTRDIGTSSSTWVGKLPNQRPMALNYANSRAHWCSFPNTQYRVFGKKSPFETPALITHTSFRGSNSIHHMEIGNIKMLTTSRAHKNKFKRTDKPNQVKHKKNNLIKHQSQKNLHRNSNPTLHNKFLFCLHGWLHINIHANMRIYINQYTRIHRITYMSMTIHLLVKENKSSKLQLTILNIFFKQV